MIPPKRINEIGDKVALEMIDQYDPTDEEKDLIEEAVVRMKKLIAQELYK